MPAEQRPLVSVICISFNHERFVAEAIDSVLKQDYLYVELIVVDNGSNDSSQQIIEQKALQFGFKTMLHDQNLGHNKAFNLAFAQCKGTYVIDLSADDLLHPERISKQVSFFQKQNPLVGVIYHRALCIDEEGKALQEWQKGKPFYGQSGDLFGPLLMRTFIPTPTMMMKREVLEVLGGYDENLSFEDFDFWVRSSRSFHYAFQDECLSSWRQVASSHSRVQLSHGRSRMLQDVLQVLTWAKSQIQNPYEKRCFVKGCQYYFTQCLKNGDWDLAFRFLTYLV